MGNNTDEKNVLETAYEYSLKLVNAIDIIYSNLQTGEELKGLELFGQLMEGLIWLNKAIELTINKEGIIINLEAQNQILLEVEASIQSKDYTTTGDLLMYEIKPMLTQWSEALKVRTSDIC